MVSTNMFLFIVCLAVCVLARTKSPSISETASHTQTLTTALTSDSISFSLSYTVTPSGGTTSSSSSASSSITPSPTQTAPSPSWSFTLSSSASRRPPLTRTATASQTLSATSTRMKIRTATQYTLSKTQLASASPSATGSQSTSGTVTLSVSLTTSKTRSIVALRTVSAFLSKSTSLSISLVPTTSVIPPTTTAPPTPTKTHITQCPNCGNGTCTNSIPFMCVPWRDTLRGFWEDVLNEGQGVWNCLTGYYGPSCLDVCPGGKCAPCSLHGQCSDGVFGTGDCLCHTSDAQGYWTGTRCHVCKSGYFGPECKEKCRCGIGSVQCVDGLAGNGSCVCAQGYAPPYCEECLDGFGGPTCSPCPGDPPCSGNGICSRAFGNCTCNGWLGADCATPCPSCPVPCLNGGLPSEDGCACGGAFVGPRCEFECPRDALGNACGNNGKCLYNGSSAFCNCSYSTSAGFWTGANCTSCAFPNLSPAIGCIQQCPWDTTACPSGYAGPACSVLCGGVLPTFGVCSGNGECRCNGDCQCNATHFGAACQYRCPDFNSMPCGGPARGACFDGNTGNGTCKCVSPFVGERCESVCDCVSAEAGFCVLSPTCVCRGNRGGPGCGACTTGWRGENCTTPCVNGQTNGTRCDCTPSWGGVGCASQCPSSPSGRLCSGFSCLDGESQGGLCDCKNETFGPSCNCTQTQCSALFPTGESICDAGTGRCVCAPGYAGVSCTECIAGSYWGSRCDEVCSCVHGECNRYTGECECYSDDSRGYWDGAQCDQCVEGYLLPDCVILSRQNPQMTSFQVNVNNNGFQYTSTSIYYIESLDAIITTGQLFTRFDGIVERSPTATFKNTSFSMTRCSRPIGSFLTENTTTLYVITSCVPLSGKLRISYQAFSLEAPVPFLGIPLNASNSPATDGSQPALPCPNFVYAAPQDTQLVEGSVLAFQRGPTRFGLTNGDALYGLPAKTNYTSSADITCMIFRVSRLDGNPGYLLRLSCVPLDPPLFSSPLGVPEVSIDGFFTALIRSEDSGEGTATDAAGVSVLFSKRYDGIFVGTTTDTGMCLIHFISADFKQSIFVRVFQTSRCRKVSGLAVMNDHLIVAFRECADTACSYSKPVVVRIIPEVRFTNASVPQQRLTYQPLSSTDVIVAITKDVLTNTVIVACNSESESFKYVRIFSSDQHFYVLGSQHSASSDKRQLASAFAVSTKRVLLLLHLKTVGVAIRRYALFEGHAVSPMIADRRGGTVITVTGSGFLRGDAKCRIGTTVTNGTAIDSNRVICIAPAAQSGACTVDSVDVSIFDGVFTINRLALRRIDFPKLVSAAPSVQFASQPVPIQITTARADESSFCKCLFLTRTLDVNGALLSENSILTNGSSQNVAGKVVIFCDAPPPLGGSTIATVDVALDGSVFSNASTARVAFLGPPSRIVADPQHFTITSAKSSPIPTFGVSIADASFTSYVGFFHEVVQFYVLGVKTKPSQNTSMPTMPLLNDAPALSLRTGKATFGDIQVSNPPAGDAYLFINMSAVFSPVPYPWWTSVTITVVPGSIQKLVFSRPPTSPLSADSVIDVEVEARDGAGNSVLGTHNVSLTAAIKEVGGSQVSEGGTEVKQQETYTSLLSAAGSASFKSLRLFTRGGFTYVVQFSLSYFNTSTYLPEYASANAADTTNTSATVETEALTPSCNSGEVRPFGSYTCVPCVENADCSDGITVVMRPGYWRSSAFSSETFPCSPSEACPGGSEASVCAEGYEGPLCSVCSAGFGKAAVRGACVACASSALNTVGLAFTVTIMLTILGFLVVLTTQSWRRQSVTVALLQVVVGHANTVMAIGAQDFRFPSFFLDIISFCGLFTLQILDFPYADCVIKSNKNNYFTKFSVYAAVAFMSFLCGGLAWVIMFISPNIFRKGFSVERINRHRRVLRKQTNKRAASKGRSIKSARRQFTDLFNAHVIDAEVAQAFDWESSSDDGHRTTTDESMVLKSHSFRLLSLYSLQVLLMFLLPSVVFYCLSVINCTTVADPTLGTRSFMNVDMSISCDSYVYQTMRVVGIAITAVYLIGAPAVYLYVYWWHLRHRTRAWKERSQLFAFVMMGIKSSAWFWPAVVLFRRGLQFVIIVLLKSPIDNQVLNWLLVAYLVLFVRIWPYASDRLNNLERICIFGEIVALTTTNLLDMYDGEDEVTIISAFALIPLLVVGLLALYFAGHRIFEAFFLAFRIHVFKGQLTESDSTDSDHQRDIERFRQNPSRTEKLEVPLLEEDSGLGLNAREGDFSPLVASLSKRRDSPDFVSRRSRIDEALL